MKKNYKILLVFVVFCIASAAIFAGGSKEFELSDKEKAEGWRYFMPIGFKLHRPAFFDTYKDNIDSEVIGEAEDTPEEVLYSGYVYSFFPDELIEAYNAIRNNKKLSTDEKWEKIDAEIVPNLKPIYALLVLRTPLIGDKKLEDITGFPYNDIVRKTKEFTQILAIADFSTENLSEKSAEIYQEMISQVKPVRKTITCIDPKSPESVMLELKGLKFDTVDLDGNKVTNDILKNYDVTMINIWATWCGPCKAELPEIAKLYEIYKGKNCNIIGITGDITPSDQEPLETAKKLTQDAGCAYTILQNNDSFNSLFKGLVAWPMTIFVDKKGNIIASSKDDLIVGSRSLEQFTEAFDKALQTVKK